MCITTYLIPCIGMGQALSEHNICGCFIGGLIPLCPIPCVTSYYISLVRSTVRERYNIEGSNLMDLVLSVFLPFCTLLQARQEFSARGMGEDIERV